jgi:hypothetical protein
LSKTANKCGNTALLLLLKTKDVLIFDTSSKQNIISYGRKDIGILNSMTTN